MKIRVSVHGPPWTEIQGLWDVVETSETYYIARQVGGSALTLIPKGWAVMEQEPVWLDVTAECQFQDGHGGIYQTGQDKIICTVSQGYRLRKIQYKKSEHRIDHWHYWETSAFVVEQRVEEAAHGPLS